MAQPEEFLEENEEDCNLEEGRLRGDEEGEEEEEMGLEDKENQEFWGDDIVLDTPLEGDSVNRRKQKYVNIRHQKALQTTKQIKMMRVTTNLGKERKKSTQTKKGTRNVRNTQGQSGGKGAK